MSAHRGVCAHRCERSWVCNGQRGDAPACAPECVHWYPVTPGWVCAYGGHGCARRCAPGVRRRECRGKAAALLAPCRGCPAVPGKRSGSLAPGHGRPGPAAGGRTGGTWSRTSAPRPGLCPAAPPSCGPALSRARGGPSPSRWQSRGRGGGGTLSLLGFTQEQPFPFCKRGPGAQPRREGPVAPAAPVTSPPRACRL